MLGELKRDPGDWLFQTSTSSQIDPSNLRKAFQKFLKDAELRLIRFHDLRQPFATAHLQAGRSPVYVMEQCGHSSIKVTGDIYGHMIPGGNRDFSDTLDD